MRQVNHFILYSITFLLLIFQILIWIVPKGTVLHENLRLIPHHSKLANINISGMEETRYPYGTHQRQYMLFFESKEKLVEQESIVYYIPGGNWQHGNPENARPIAKYFTDRGYNIFITSYRLTPQFHCDDMQVDIQLSFKKLMEILKEKNWSNRKILLVGDSAGSNLAALLLYNEENLKKSNVDQSKFDAFVSIAGALDISRMTKTPTLLDYINHDTTKLDAVNPINYLKTSERTPVLAIHGTADGCINYQSSKKFVQQLNTIQPNLAQMLTIHEGTHLSVTGEWLYKNNEVRHFLDHWLTKKEQQVNQ